MKRRRGKREFNFIKEKEKLAHMLAQYPDSLRHERRVFRQCMQAVGIWNVGDRNLSIHLKDEKFWDLVSCIDEGIPYTNTPITKSPPKKPILTPIQKQFCKNLICTRMMSVIEASRTIDASYHTCTQWMELPHVQEYIQKLIKDRNAKLRIKAENIMFILWNVATGNVHNFFDYSDPETGEIHWKDPSQLTADEMAQVKEIKTTTRKFKNGGYRTTTTIKLKDTARHMELLMRHMGMLKGDQQQLTDEDLEAMALAFIEKIEQKGALPGKIG
jgi:hypothetical protein